MGRADVGIGIAKILIPAKIPPLVQRGYSQKRERSAIEFVLIAGYVYELLYSIVILVLLVRLLFILGLLRFLLARWLFFDSCLFIR